ncbi:hypothetical protein RMN57_00150 [Kitasatospora sp. CM 4170]|uniref:Uncharacterized protein n=1 Tax=Kitasatospora aburaviensis TaxID=67265 RepID=A0ABW1FCI9_9ACTN|nr:hypothetical protein [Kitasatospora sp. CM 4170]WNM43223.1 hypothetical protein RMN57_00150 [Kitasatospora sp. CM 4170]
MNSWINLDALWRIAVVGLLTGAGLPALFAIGVRALNPPTGDGEAAAGRPAVGPLRYTVAGLCFAVVLAAIGWGIYVIVNHS